MKKIKQIIQNGLDDPDVARMINVEQFALSIYTKYNSGLERYLKRRLKFKFERDDVAQSVYLRLMRIENTNEIKPSLAFLCTIASNILKDKYKSRQVRKQNDHVPMDEVKLADTNPSPEQVLFSKESIDEFTKLYESLNPKARMAFSLHRFKGMKYDEIAVEMGISYDMVKKHISSVLLKIRKKYGESI